MKSEDNKDATGRDVNAAEVSVARPEDALQSSATLVIGDQGPGDRVPS